MSALPASAPKADWLHSFRVSDADRRTKVVGARTRGVQSMVYGDLNFRRLWRRMEAGQKRTDLEADRLLFGSA
jgi:hypothetical protein